MPDIQPGQVVQGPRWPEPVEVDPDGSPREPLYMREPFGREPDFGVTSVTYGLRELVGRRDAPS